MLKISLQLRQLIDLADQPGPNLPPAARTEGWKNVSNRLKKARLKIKRKQVVRIIF
jgi:hypothetical protein